MLVVGFFMDGPRHLSHVAMDSPLLTYDVVRPQPLPSMLHGVFPSSPQRISHTIGKYKRSTAPIFHGVGVVMFRYDWMGWQ